jgi:nitrogen fixation/metabolism regulation signal transduction histidine kinase
MAGIFTLGLLLYAAVVLAGETWTSLPLWLIHLMALGIALPPAILAVGRALRPLGRTLETLSDGILGFQDRDFSMRLASDRDDELGDLVRLYNRVGEILQEERGQLRQRELLLQTALDQSPVAIVLTNPLDRILYANQEARRLFMGGTRLGGRRFSEILEHCPGELRDLLAAARDGIFTVEGKERPEIYHLAERSFFLNRRRHRLILLRRMTTEMARQEAEVWKKVIRVISHEINNSLAPISSMAHSGLLIAGNPEQLHRLEPIYLSIRERIEHLTGFLEGYARFARLPKPKPQTVEWGEWLEGLRGLFAFKLTGEPPETPGRFDPAQMQQALINLLKNAKEASDGGDGIEVRVDRLPDGVVRVQVLDRGRGMNEEVMRRALLPFYSTKPAGSGVGLPLCREIVEAHGGSLRIQSRSGGGTVVSFWLPPPSGPRSPH